MDPFIKAGVALVTGAGSGIGQEVSRLFASHGCKKLFLVDISIPGLEQTQELIQKESSSTEVTICRTNITVENEVKSMIADCVKAYGRIDFASNNAGVGTTNSKTADMTVDMYDKICAVNEKGVSRNLFYVTDDLTKAFWCEKYEIMQMLKQDPLPIFEHDYQIQRGSIVNTASLCGIAVIGTLPAYNSSKHAVVQMSAVDARQYAAEKIRINTVCPGFVDTPMFRGSGLTKEYLDGAKAQSPMYRLLHPREIANGIIFLSGSQASGITGINLPIDCGAQLYHII